MAGNHKRRKRSIDVGRLTPAQADNLSAQIGIEISKIMDEANLKCNKLLNIYGLQTRIGYDIVKIDNEIIKKDAKL